MKQFLDCLAIIVLVGAAVFILAGVVILVIPCYTQALIYITILSGLAIVVWACDRLYNK